MSHDCPHCGEPVATTDGTDSMEGALSFFKGAWTGQERAEGHFDCPHCGDVFYIDLIIKSIST